MPHGSDRRPPGRFLRNCLSATVQAPDRAIHPVGPPGFMNTDRRSQLTHFFRTDPVTRSGCRFSIEGNSGHRKASASDDIPGTPDHWPAKASGGGRLSTIAEVRAHRLAAPRPACPIGGLSRKPTAIRRYPKRSGARAGPGQPSRGRRSRVRNAATECVFFWPNAEGVRGRIRRARVERYFGGPMDSRSISLHSSFRGGTGLPSPGARTCNCSIAQRPIARCGRTNVVRVGVRWREISSSS